MLTFCVSLPSQCICNSFTKPEPVPTATPTESTVPTSAPSTSSVPTASAAPTTSDKFGEGTGSDVISGLPDNSCQIYNPESTLFYEEPHKYQAVIDLGVFDGCFAGDECPEAGTCCTIEWCMCMAITDESYCL
jgi:hypothetical protein